MIALQKSTSLARKHLQSMHIGSEVTRWFRKDREQNVIDVTPERVIAALHRAGINCVLMGTHGINGYRDEARATQDVDVLVTRKDVRKAVRVLEEAFPYLELIENAAVARFLDPVTQKPVLDVMKPSSSALRVVFRHTLPIGKTHRIPDLEMAVVSKFIAMIGPNRKPEKKLLDAGDFTNMVVHNRKTLDLPKLQRLADRVRPGGGRLILGFVKVVDSGRTIQI